VNGGWSRTESPYHDGERAMHARLGIVERVERVGRSVIRTYMPEQHRELFAALPLVMVGSLDHGGMPWASILTGAPGFVAAPDSTTLAIHALPHAFDPFARNLAVGARVGLLGLQLETRRRNRANGIVTAVDDGGFVVHVEQSFGNCPKYIQVRGVRPREQRPAPALAGIEGARLSDAALAYVRAADTMFIASASASAVQAPRPSEGVDVSHRGGRPGFVAIHDDGDATTLTIPDYVGNFAFNTIGNLLVEPRVGLVIPDFVRGGTLQLCGTSRIVFDGPELAAFDGAQRLVQVRVIAGVRTDGVLPFAFTPPRFAPELER
jgi:predicted pyridoxine 5'-phosphate oxidase superfamily flavin-nucleotide-binding protein